MSRQEEGSIVPVVFAVNNGYAPYLYVSLMSLIKYTAPNEIYQIYVLHTGLEKKHIERIEDLGRDNVHVECKNVEKSMQGIKIKGSVHLTVETCYRLLIPELFPQYLRMLYIDSDTLILSDVAELYYSNLSGKTIGAVHDVVCTYLEEYYAQHVGMNVEEGFNAGILVIDMTKFREKRIREKCIGWLIEDSKNSERKYVYMDQDVLNLALRHEVCFLESEWNFQWQYLWRLETILPEYLDNYIKDSKKARIIHYAGDKKPWARPDLEKADLFWMAARKSVYYEEILFRNFMTVTGRKNDLFKGHIFPFSEIEKDSNIVLYGAGDVGRTLYEQNELIGYVNILLWIDRNPRDMNIKGVTIDDIQTLVQFPQIYDYVLIAIDDSRICGQVKEKLVKLGLPSKKIMWCNYRR